MTRNPLLSLENIDAGYGKRQILHDISLKIQTEDLLAIIGHNGSGKSTLLKVICGFISPISGSIFFEGADLRNAPVYRRVRHGISYLIQGGKIFPSLTVKENMELGLKHKKNDDNHVQSDMEPVLELFPELKKLQTQRSGLLSGGERQMLALAMILVHRPRLLLLDEPSAGLSPALVNKIFERIQNIHQEWNVSIILVEQNAGKALEVATDAHIMVNGTFADPETPHTQWLDSGTLDEYFLGKTN